MQLCRFQLPGVGPRLGRVADDEVVDLTDADARCATLAALLQASVTTPLAELLEPIAIDGLPRYRYADLDHAPADDRPHLLPPVDAQEVWAAGVTYAWSREARVREATSKDVYERVYGADRPELFFKSPGAKVVGPHDWIGVRGDSAWNVPEPELVLVVNPAMQIVGYSVGNDVSSRAIEGENPLYLPQAKMYRHACAVGPTITLADATIDPQNLALHMLIARAGAPVFQGETSTTQLHRSLAELVAYLGRYNDFPHGALLFTGTGIVPPDDFTLHDADDVTITIAGLGVLRNPVRVMA